MRILIDIDNTLADLNTPLWRRFPDADRAVCHGAPVTPRWFASLDGMALLAAAEPVPGAVPALRRLVAAGFMVIYVTGRPPETGRVTRVWLGKHRLPTGPICYGPAKRKALWARVWGVRLAVDDDPAAALWYRRAGIMCSLPLWPYNAHDPDAAPWDAIVDRVLCERGKSDVPHASRGPGHRSHAVPHFDACRSRRPDGAGPGQHELR